LSSPCSGPPISLLRAPENRPDSRQVSVINRESRQIQAPAKENSLPQGIPSIAAPDDDRQGGGLGQRRALCSRKIFLSPERR
jgi:hypothetical protein